MISLYPEANETIVGVSRDIATGRLSCVELLNRCLARIDTLGEGLRAWVVVDREGATRQARALDVELMRTGPRGALYGIPIGIKDIIDVRGLPTAAGFEPWKSRIAKDDAPVVAVLRAAGAVIVGKTVTTQFACFDPPPTKNPWNRAHTPGGSSSGSAVAVATGMCLAALGTQTGGSITRPASYCGVCGLKPTHGALSVVGIVPVSGSLDHVGPMGRCVSDLDAIWRAMRPDTNQQSGDVLRASAPVFGVVEGIFRNRAADAMREAFDAAVRRLAQHGATITRVAWSPPWEPMLHAHRLIMVAEGARAHGVRLDESPLAILPGMRSFIEEGRSVSPCDYQEAATLQRHLRSEVDHALEPESFWLTPATPGPAPDTTTTGDPSFNAPWSLLGVPTVSLPIAVTADNLPMAMQIIARHGHEDGLLHAAQWIEDVIRHDT